MITKEQLLHLAKLSGLRMSPENLDAAQEKMSAVVGLIQQLDELKLDDSSDSVSHSSQNSIGISDAQVYTDFWSDAVQNVKHDIVDKQLHLRK